jgi:hypothetical protein
MNIYRGKHKIFLLLSVSLSVPLSLYPFLLQDKKLLESCCLTFSRLVEQLKTSPVMLMELCKDGLITNLQQVLSLSLYHQPATGTFSFSLSPTYSRYFLFLFTTNLQ